MVEGTTGRPLQGRNRSCGLQRKPHSLIMTFLSANELHHVRGVDNQLQVALNGASRNSMIASGSQQSCLEIGASQHGSLCRGTSRFLWRLRCSTIMAPAWEVIAATSLRGRPQTITSQVSAVPTTGPVRTERTTVCLHRCMTMIVLSASF